MTLRELGYSIANLPSNIEYYVTDMFVTLHRDPLDLQIDQIIILLFITGNLIFTIVMIANYIFDRTNPFLDNLLDGYKFAPLCKGIVFSSVYLLLGAIFFGAFFFIGYYHLTL